MKTNVHNLNRRWARSALKALYWYIRQRRRLYDLDQKALECDLKKWVCCKKKLGSIIPYYILNNDIFYRRQGGEGSVGRV